MPVVLLPGTEVDGVVAEYDDHVGLGWVEVAGTRLLVHCTQVADGSRHLDAGAPVRLRVLAGHGGRLEAGAVRPVGPAQR